MRSAHNLGIDPPPQPYACAPTERSSMNSPEYAQKRPRQKESV